MNQTIVKMWRGKTKEQKKQYEQQIIEQPTEINHASSKAEAEHSRRKFIVVHAIAHGSNEKKRKENLIEIIDFRSYPSDI